MRLGNDSRSLRAALALAALLVAGIAAAFVVREPEQLVSLHDEYGLAATLVLLPLQTLISLSLSPIPSDVVAFALALIHGFARGTILIWIGWMAGAVIQYELSRRVVEGTAWRERMDRAPQWLRRLPPDHPLFLICGRWLPLGPHLVNTVAGAAGVPRPRFLLTAAVGILPVATLIAALAAGLLDLRTG